MSVKEHGPGPIDSRYIKQMQELAAFLDHEFNQGLKGDQRHTGFILLVFGLDGKPGADRCNYISNGLDRKDIASLFREMAAKFEGQPDMKPGRA